jgi:molybdopterin/thiamine biosynthesis adenylyltransferase
MDGLMDRQASLNLRTVHGVAVVGCGGVGSWVAYMLALAGAQAVYLFDKDTISPHNLNRLPVDFSEVNKRKSDAVRRFIKRVRPSCEVYSAGDFDPFIADEMGLGSEISHIIATTDTLKSRKMVRGWAANKGISYFEAAAEGSIGTVTDSPGDFATPDEENPGYASVPVWVGPCVLSAAVVVGSIVHGLPFYDRTYRIGFGEKGVEFFDSMVKKGVAA